MNIFATNACPIQSAREHTDVHVIKMILESAQLLSTAHFVLDGHIVGYKPTHKNHPSSVWCRNTSGNYIWLHSMFVSLCEEYTFRTGKIHKTSGLIDVLSKTPSNIISSDVESFALAMPDSYKLKGIFDPTKAYQAYLVDKLHGWMIRPRPMKVAWSKRETPNWFVQSGSK